jgi:hypothetical protein
MLSIALHQSPGQKGFLNSTLKKPRYWVTFAHFTVPVLVTVEVVVVVVVVVVADVIVPVLVTFVVIVIVVTLALAFVVTVAFLVIVVVTVACLVAIVAIIAVFAVVPTTLLAIQQASNFKIFLYFRLQVTLPENDSQNNSGLSRSNLKSYRASLTVKEIADIDGVLKDCGLPTCDSFPLTSESFTKALELS